MLPVLTRSSSCHRIAGVAVLLVAVLGMLAGASPVSPVSAATAASGPVAGGSSQWITVIARSHSVAYARLVAYQRAGGHWVRVFGPWTARVGYNGIARPGAKREGDGRTPSGTYGFGFFFGVLANPGVRFPYRRAHPYDVWDDDPASPRYNEWVDERYVNPGANPEPMDQRPAYDYAAVIAYNTKRVPGLGSAIFLHVGTGSATAGCVSLPRADLLRILRWLRPADRPQIAITAR